MSSLFSSTIQSQGTKGSPLIPANEFWHKQCVWQAVAGQHLWVQTSSIPRVNPSHVCNPHIHTVLILGVLFLMYAVVYGAWGKVIKCTFKVKKHTKQFWTSGRRTRKKPFRTALGNQFLNHALLFKLMYRWWTLRGMHLTISWTETFSDNKRLNGGDFFRTLFFRFCWERVVKTNPIPEPVTLARRDGLCLRSLLWFTVFGAQTIYNT